MAAYSIVQAGTRNSSSMTEPATWTVWPLSVHVPLGERRNPVAMVRLAVGPLEVVLPVSRLRKSGLAVRSPMADSGVPAVSASPEMWAEIERAALAAVTGDPAAREHVLGRLLKRAPVSPA